MIKHKPKHYTDTSKIVCDKKNFLVHYRNLKFYVRIGMIIEKIHKILSFKQSFWLENYIDFCSTGRALSKTDSEVAFCKSLEISFFGKTIENIRNCVNVQFIRNCEVDNVVKAKSKLSFDGIRHVYENYSSYMFKNHILKMEKPIHLGFSSLDLRKLLMYETFYEKFQIFFWN